MLNENEDQTQNLDNENENESEMATMRACTAERIHCKVDGAGLKIVDDRPKPVRKNKKQMVIRVLATSLAPGDVRVMSGDCDIAQAPPSFPYIPGGDVCGIVEDVAEGAKFKKGDCVISMFHFAPRDRLAEYALVYVNECGLKPKSISPVEACAIPSSVLSAHKLAQMKIRKGDRVLVLGGTGGVGAHLVQLAKHVGASYVAATGSDMELLTSLGVDRAHNYQDENDKWWELQEYLDNPFDVVVDLVGGPEGWAWPIAKRTKAVKSGCWNRAKYVALVGEEPHFKIHTYLQGAMWMGGMLGRGWWTVLNRRVPRFGFFLAGLDPSAKAYAEIAEIIDNGALRIVLDPISPVPFEADRIQQGFQIMEARHAHGKICVQVAEE